MTSTLRSLASLPPPDPDAARASARLRARIAEAIDAAGGLIGFDRFMALALYEPGLGYYAGGARKFGAGGDFTTAPELSPLFGQTLARTLAPALRTSGATLSAATEETGVLELGAGTGRLACDLLDGLAELDALPHTYAILEVSADLRDRQHTLLAQRHPGLAERVRWLDRLPERWRGVMLANEVLDVLPTHALVWPAEGPARERCVRADGEAFAWTTRALPDGELATLAAGVTAQVGIVPPYESELSPAVGALVRALTERLEAGIALFIDYGFGRREYYHPQRRQGTLMCHYRQHAHTDPFFLPGLQDITVHVDFTAVAEAALQAGGELAGYTSQAGLLLDAGLLELLARTPADQPARYLPQAAAAQRLLSPAEMGELFKAMAIRRGPSMRDLALPGFRRLDLARTL